MPLRFFQRPLTSMYSTTSATQSFPSFFPPLDRDEDICEPFSLSLSSAEGRKAEGKEKRWNGMQCGRCCSREDSHAETRYSPSASPVLSGDCVYTGRDAASFVPDRYEWTHHSHPWLSGARFCVAHPNNRPGIAYIYIYIYIYNICIYIYSCIRGPANSHG